MKSLKLRLFAIGIGLLIAYAAFIFIYPMFFVGNPTIGSLGFYLIIGFTVLLLISGFLPYNWGKLFREISYLLLFASILVAELVAIKPMVQGINISVGNCEKVFVPSTSSSSSLYNALSYTSCVMTGYYPKESPMTANVAWVSFYIFYLILPFTFIWVLMYGLMNSIGMDQWLVGSKHINRLLSFIIALFAMRVFIGEALLEFLGYGAWGLAGVFVAIFLVAGLRHMIEQWYKIEGIGAEVKKEIEMELDSFARTGRQYAKSVLRLIESMEYQAKYTLSDTNGKITIINQIINKIDDENKSGALNKLWSELSIDQRDKFKSAMNSILSYKSMPQKEIDMYERFKNNILKKMKKTGMFPIKW